MKKIKIGNKLIGEGEPCFIIAEVGVNHNGDIRLAKELIEKAKEVGADAVKFQTFQSENLVTQTTEMADYQKINIGQEQSQLEMLKKLELSQQDFVELKECARAKDILFLSTPYDKASVDILEKLNILAFKISSADITNHPLLGYIASKNLPVIFSSGMSTLGEIEEAINVMRATGNEKLILLHCNFNYPARLEEVNLRAMKTLETAFQIPVGYSDHTMGIEVPIAAVVLGARVIEKHFTLDRGLPGPDHKASLEPKELKEMVEKIRNVERALGSFRKFPTKSEAKNRKISRRSIVAATDISRGTVIGPGMICVKRPGTGIAPKYLKKVIGQRATQDIKEDELINWNKIKLT